ncbi:MAG: HAD family hydrolase [Candidatus Ratteibacteria bacterium]|jgi:phosphoglycolate phosphatase-like HAD superfamily hydrolase
MPLAKLTQKEIKEDPEQQLRNFKRTKDFLVAIDTDGCVTDNMNGKQILIFHPQYMEFYQLWGIESYFRELSEYYNLFSIHRGCNRFLAAQFILKALAAREDIAVAAKENEVLLPEVKPLDDYIAYCGQNNLGLGNPSLEKFLATRPLDLALYKLLGWSEAVNRTFPFVNPKIPPFDNVRESLKLMAENADVLVVSQTPYEDLVNYWETQGISEHICFIAGQEMGNKTHHIQVIKEAGGYEDSKVLMLGDGDGDYKAVNKNNGLFYPIPAGLEREAWRKFPERFELFFKGQYRGEVADKLFSEFSKVLLTTPPWEVSGYDHKKAYREKQEIRKSLYAKLNPNGRLLVL